MHARGRIDRGLVAVADASRRSLVVRAVSTALLMALASDVLARPGDDNRPTTQRSDAAATKVPDAIRIVANPVTLGAGQTAARDVYWQLYLEPGVGYDVASAADRQALWERILSSFWSSSESASAVVQLVLAAGTQGSPTPERPILLMMKKDGHVDASVKAKPEALTGYFRAVADPRARIDVALGYSTGVDQKLIATGLKIIERVGPALGLPAKWVVVAARQSTKELGEKADRKLSSLLTSSAPATASKQFEIGKVESFDFQTLGDSPVTLAKVSIRTRESLLVECA